MSDNHIIRSTLVPEDQRLDITAGLFASTSHCVWSPSSTESLTGWPRSTTGVTGISMI